VFEWTTVSNFGDRLSVPLIRRFAGVEALPWSVPNGSDLFACGSVLTRVPAGFEGTILGTGSLRDFIPPDLSRARILAVRGPLSLSLVLSGGGTVPGSILGDPGLLAPALLDETSWHDQYAVGVVPHWSDDELAARFPDAHRIDVRCAPEVVVRQIAGCARLVTSSLHAQIVADALGIPSAAYPHKRGQLREGGSYKWDDYAGALGMDHEWGVTRVAPADAVRRAQRGLESAFAALGEHP